ncbi:hypothetical protein A1O7_08519 [Cladophialophora yegresii CBS 114405]|uniref:Calcium channel YVC1-like C-terminal transmembrane domain-containing protein n=1 Tax=Cladophialophora yegresii CBS 114405 TaxID=1182544 RepID=W9VTU7_9EURO|nr:uncharacterized protein A1O7_08519 [Cladophialophora yegresii CBS 114405]EXJ55591.1 hypothetical protein A1O7_08519 [Cladophialophora yegresii CBS 114405]
MAATTNPQTPRSTKTQQWMDDDVPIIDSREAFSDVVLKLSSYIAKAIDTPFTYEQLRTTVAGQSLRPLISNLSEECHHPAVVAALLAARYLFINDPGDVDPGLNESRGLACELVAWQFLTFLSEKELIDYLLYDLPEVSEDNTRRSPSETHTNSQHTGNHNDGGSSNESSPLLRSRSSEHGNFLRPPRRASTQHTDRFTSGATTSTFGGDEDGASRRADLDESMAGMNALEIAAIGDAKKFISKSPVQKIVEDIWNGDVIFWESLSVHAVKKPRAYNKRVADPFTRLRVPKYQKAFQISFFLAFLLLYYAVLVERNPRHITPTEAVLYVFIAAFAYDEFGEIKDAGIMFYQTDFWSLWDIAIIGVSAAFVVTRVVGLVRDSDYIIDVAFDILSMVALFLVPRIFSVMSLNPYFGSLIPVLKEMPDNVMWVPTIIVLYLGFLTTFTMLARDRMTLNDMSWLLIKVFFGSSYLGFDMAVKISPLFGYTLMLVFVCLTNILLITSLVSLVSNSLTEVMAHAREEYLFQYSIYVLESSTSRRLTYFMPPLNLFPLIVLRPLRLFLPSEEVRRIRIFVLKATHIPFVALIWAYENSRTIITRPHPTLSKAPHLTSRPLSAGQLNFDGSRDFLKSPTTRRALNETSPSVTADMAASTTRSALGSAESADLIALIQKLSAQVDGLTAMVAGQSRD